MIFNSGLDFYILINKVLLFLVDIFAIWLIVVVYSANPKGVLNRLFTLLTVAFLFWGNGGYFFAFSKNLDLSLFLGRLILGEVSLFFIAFYFFSVYFPYKDKPYPFLDKIILVSGFGLFFLTTFTTFIVKSVRLTEWGTDPVFNPVGKFIFYGFTAFFTFLILFQLFKKYFILPEKDKLKAQYFLLGIFIFILMNIIFNILLPAWRDSIQYWQFGNYSAIFLLGLAAFAIVRQELFGIKVILTQALVGIVAALLLFQAVTTTNWFEFSWKFALFLLFLVFGYFLIQSVIREIQRRAELQRLYDELEKLDEAKTEFMSIVSHQLRTPLTAIKGYVSMIMEGLYGNFTEKMKKPLDNVFASNERLIKFVNDILNVTRIETGRLEFIPEKTSMEEVISSVIFELEIKSKEKNLYLKWDPPPRFGEGQEKELLPQILIDPDKIRQVILNLIDNAIKYTKEGGVTVKCKVQNEKCKIEVSDTGAGMTQEDIQKLFRSFSRGESGVTYYKEGTGLGLYIARQFVELQGGKVWAESEGKGKGSTFYIELPIK